MTKSTEVGLRGDLQKINRNRKIGAKLRPPYPQRIVCLSEAAEKMYRVRKSGARHRARPEETGGAYVRRLLRHGATGRES